MACERKPAPVKAEQETPDNTAILPQDNFPEYSAQQRQSAASIAEGRRFRVVWVEQRDSLEPDPFANLTGLRLAGFDSSEGYRAITRATGSVARPLLSPDGQTVFYTNKRPVVRQGKTILQPQIWRVGWDGLGARMLGDGHAVDVNLDPVTGSTWVYAVEELSTSIKSSLQGRKLVRFNPESPEKRDLLWSKSLLSLDNIQFSADASRFSAQFPHPDSGIGFPHSDKWKPVSRGCWSALAPDNSYLFWIFSGGHKALRLHAPGSSKPWLVAVSDAPGINGEETYHPRWTNHPQFIVMTGPYPKNPKKRGSSVFYAGQSAEIYLGRLNSRMNGFDGWLCLTSNSYGDFFPDAWIENGDRAALQAFPQAIPDAYHHHRHEDHPRPPNDSHYE